MGYDAEVRDDPQVPHPDVVTASAQQVVLRLLRARLSVEVAMLRADSSAGHRWCWPQVLLWHCVDQEDVLPRVIAQLCLLRALVPIPVFSLLSSSRLDREDQ